MPERDARHEREEGFLLSRDLCPPSSRCLICEEFSAAAAARIAHNWVMLRRDFRTKTTTMVALQSKPNLAKSNGTEVFFTRLMAKSGGVRSVAVQGRSSRSEEGQAGEGRWTVLMGTYYESSHTHSSHLTSPPSPLSVISLGMGQFCEREGLVRTSLLSHISVTLLYAPLLSPYERVA